MQYLKFVILVMIFILSIIIGKTISSKYILRLTELEELKNALNIFKTKVKFTYDPIPKIFDDIARNSSKNISRLFINAKEEMKNKTASLAWENAVDNFLGNINYEDKQVMKVLAKLLRCNRC